MSNEAKAGVLYPGLLRLEQRGSVRAQWDRARMAAIMQATLEGAAR
jgi:hypothetical protein